MAARSFRSFWTCFALGLTRAAKNFGGTPYRRMLSQNSLTAQMCIQALKACKALPDVSAPSRHCTKDLMQPTFCMQLARHRAKSHIGMMEDVQAWHCTQTIAPIAADWSALMLAGHRREL